MCTDLQYSIRVKHAAPHVLGVFEAFSQDPLSYDVSGAFTIIRYTKKLKEFLSGVGGQTGLAKFLGKNISKGSAQELLYGNVPGTALGTTPDGVSSHGNGIGTFGPDNGMDALVGSMFGNAFGAMSRADQSFDPSKLHVPMMFDIEVQQKAADNETGILARLRNCRITGSDFKLSRRGLAVQTFTFQACYADEDSFNAGVSGVGQTQV
jgi:hypothetical protein